MQGVATSRYEIAAALGWLVEAGCDTIVGDAAFPWLADAGPVAPLVVADPAPVRSEARAINADSLGALAAAYAEAYPAALFADGTPGDVMVIGERPTTADAAAGRVFADAGGAMLDRMLASIGRDRGSAYLANIVAWPLPADRAATAAEIAAASPYLRRQIVLARPRCILALGQTAAAALTGSTAGIVRLRGKWATIDGLDIAVMPTFAPAHLLQQPGHKALAWADLCAFRDRLDA